MLPLGGERRHTVRVTRILFATDFHGIVDAYEALVDHVRARRPDAVVLGGDLLPFPMIGQDAIAVQVGFVEDGLRSVFARIAELGAVTYVIHGNDDWATAVQRFDRLEAAGLVRYVHRRAIPLADGWSIAGLGLVPVTPFYMKDFDRCDDVGWRPAVPPPVVHVSDGQRVREGDLDEIYARPTLAEELAGLGRVSAPDRTVYVVHTPPAGGLLDVMHGGNHIGSDALRRFLETHQPPLSLHGHVHESPDLTGSIVDRIGATVAVNPGASALGFRGAWVELAPAGGEPVRVEPVGAAAE